MQKPVEEPQRSSSNPLPVELLEILVCPQSKGPLIYVGGEAGEGFLLCPTSRLKYRIEAGVPVMLVDEAEELPADAVARLVGSQAR